MGGSWIESEGCLGLKWDYALVGSKGAKKGLQDGTLSSCTHREGELVKNDPKIHICFMVVVFRLLKANMTYLQ